MATRMHDDEIDTDDDLVRRLLRNQHPQWAELPLKRAASTGTDNAMYRLGDDMVVRLPLRRSATSTVERQLRWLPIFEPHLPTTIPVPVAAGVASDDFPSPWSILPWLEGEDGTFADVDLNAAARDLAQFVRALQAIDPAGGPVPSAANYGRGVPLADRDEYTRRSIHHARHLVDTVAATEAWERSLAALAWDRPAVWVHGDLAAGNLLFQNGRLSAVIDFGAFGIGDPACDVSIAWEFFDGESREVFRHELGVDDAMWERSRGWALSTAMAAWPYYEHTNAFMAEQARRKIDLILCGSEAGW